MTTKMKMLVLLSWNSHLISRITRSLRRYGESESVIALTSWRWRELFELIDRNHDGHLSRLEFIKCINESPEQRTNP